MFILWFAKVIIFKIQKCLSIIIKCVGFFLPCSLYRLIPLYILLNFVHVFFSNYYTLSDNFRFGFKEFVVSYNLRQKPILGIKGDVVTFTLYYQVSLLFQVGICMFSLHQV